MSKRKFKVGDKVVAKVGTGHNRKGDVGTVLDYGNRLYRVRFTHGSIYYFRGVELDAYVEKPKKVEKKVKPKKQVHTGQYQVGDRVVAVHNNIDRDKYVGKVGTIVDISECGDGYPYYVEFDDFNHIKIWCSVKPIPKEEPKKEEPKNTIVIYQRDRDVVALDKTTGKKCFAHCHPDDKFDFKTGAKIAFDRLIGEPVGTDTIKVGDLVEFTGTGLLSLVVPTGTRGRVVCFDNDMGELWVGVDFKKAFALTHTLDGAIKTCTGYWLTSEQIKKVN